MEAIIESYLPEILNIVFIIRVIMIPVSSIIFVL